MLHKFGYVVVALVLIMPVSAAERPGSIAGYVRSATGSPQMGAMVEVVSSTVRELKAFTNDAGYYSVSGLAPGSYSVRVAVPSFLPSIKESLGVEPGATLVVNLTLNSLFDSIQLGSPRSQSQDDDWKWVLRSVGNRPVLRALDPQTVAGKDSGSDSDLSGSLSFVAGSPAAGYGSPADMTTNFEVEKSVFSTGTVAFDGNVGYGSGAPAAVVRAAYVHRLPNGSAPTVSFTMRRFASPDPILRNADFQSMAINTSDEVRIGDVVELRFGSELQTIQFMGRMNAARPYGSFEAHLSPNTVLEYDYRSSVPVPHGDDSDSVPGDLIGSAPRVSIVNFSASEERDHHHEVALSHRFGDTNLQIAAYADRVSDPALIGVGEVTAASGDVLPDLYSQTFTYQGADFSTQGVRVMVQRKLNPDVLATFDYGYGGALELTGNDANLENAQHWMRTRKCHSLTGKLSGQLPMAGTHWAASYRWVSEDTLTAVDMFNASAGQSDPYLNISLRQPIPGMAGHVEALVDVRNLLAQGYVPLMGQDGKTVYLVQSSRAVRGGLAFTF
jgi:hypothetical protein